MASPITLGVGFNGKAAVRFDRAIMDLMLEQLRDVAPDAAEKIIRKAITKAAEIGRAALEAEVRGIGSVTGNLLRAVAVKNKTYKNNKYGIPVAISVVGYRRSGTGDSKRVGNSQIKVGNDRAFHSHLVEFGTKRRLPGKNRVVLKRRSVVDGRRVTEVVRRKTTVQGKSVVMSSFNTTAEFGNRFLVRVKPSVGLGKMPALHPVEHAFHGSKTAMQSSLMAGIENAVDEACAAFVARTP